MPAPAVTQAAIKRALDASTQAGLTVTAVEIGKDGVIRLEYGQHKAVDNPPNGPPKSGPKPWPKR
jgi:hypothetical protein